MGDCNAPANWSNSAFAPAQPPPHRSVMRFASFRNAARASSAASGGRTTGAGGDSPASGVWGLSSAGRSATSPGITTTQTQRSATARRSAISSTRGIWAGLEISSQ